MAAKLTGVIASILLALNTFFWAVFLFFFTFLKIIIPIKAVRIVITAILNWIAECWIYGNSGWMHLTQKMDWKVQLPDTLDKKGWYFVISNHQSWVDIL
ncbi:MAG TPA: acyltransferase, partial [Pseudomonadales bacterium]|nr:acyltransferase [Pseudomonadales bacterium]